MVVNKHGSFYLRSGWGTKIIQAVNADDMIFTPANEMQAVDNIGLGRVMIKALRYWADATGLTSEQKVQGGIREEKTDIYMLIDAKDRYFQKPGSLLLLHRNLARNDENATAWYWAFNELMYNSFEVTKILIIAPLRVARNTWSDEIKKWDHLKGLRYSIAVGTATERKKALAADADIFIINRENVQWLVEQSGVPFDFDMVVIDELSSFKNWQAKRFKSFMKVRPMVKRVVGLTGTPSSNGLMDLFAEFKVLDMGERLGRFIGQYRVNYFKPDRMNGPIVYTYKLLPGAEDRIYDKISDITISMKETDYLEMPELISTEYKVYLDDTEKAKYEALRDEFVLQLPGGEITASNAATLSGKLSQLANGAIYSDDGDVNIFHERKLDALEDLIEAANGKPVLVAYWFKHDLRRISERLSNLGIDYQQLDSDASIKKWNAGQLQVGLIHPASAGHGLNLQSGGNILVWFGITWSLELYQQTVARLWRQGQTEGTVSVIHIVTDGTVDERILKALEAKDLTQSALIDAVKAEVGDGK